MPQTLWNKGFIALLITQFTVAFNDNCFRWLLVPIGKEYANGDLIRFLGGAFLILPFLLWTSIAGYVTDRFSRRNAIIWCKTIELVLLASALFVIAMGPAVNPATASAMPLKLYLLLGIMFLLGSQAAFFSPSKYGTIPDLVPETSISTANGMISMLTMLACVSGQILGGYIFFWTTLYDNKLPAGIPGGHHLWITAAFLIGMASIGLLSSTFIPKMKAVDPQAKFPVNLFWQTGKDIAALFSYKKLFWVSLASAFFWGIAALAQNNIDKYATEYLFVQQQHVTVLAAVLTIGIGIGAVLCGWLSGRRIEMGLVPVGAFGMGLFILILGFTPAHPDGTALGHGTPYDSPYLFATIIMLATGLFAGLYDIPLAAYIQEKSPPKERGRMIAAYNFCTFSAMFLFIGLGLAGAFIFNRVHEHPSLMIWIMTGCLCLAVSAALAHWFDGALMVFVLRYVLHIVYRPKVIGLENLPEHGAALLICNHVSLLDGPIVYACSPRNIQFIASDETIPKMFEPCCRETHLIKIHLGNPKNVIKGLRQAKEALQQGCLVGIFAEGGITRNGQMKHFESGFLSLLKGNENVPVIPCHIGGLHESMFGYKYGRIYGDTVIKFHPRRLPQRVVIAFGKPMYGVKYPQQVQLAVQELGVDHYMPKKRDSGHSNTSRLPVMSVPQSEVFDTFHIYEKEGSAGRACPNSVVKVIDRHTGDTLPPDTVGTFAYKTPLNSGAKCPDWVITNLTGRMDADGFVFLS